MLTIAYMTNHKEPQISWFIDSLILELGRDGRGVKLVIVDFFAEERGKTLPALPKIPNIGFESIWHGPPKPTVWQGKHRLTKHDYFAAANARNTAICLAPDGYLVCVDDLSVLSSGWMSEVKAAQSQGYIACGAYMKVFELEVLNGVIKNYDHNRIGMDSRYHATKGMEPVNCGGEWLFGCSFASPVEALLKINGFDEACDGSGAEDYIAGLMLVHHGFELRYCKRMMTVESEEGHCNGSFPRIKKDNVHGHQDNNFAILNMVKNGGRNVAPNFGNMRELRASVLSGNQFPIARIPEHDWRDGQPLREM